MHVICLEEAAFYALVEQVVERLREKQAAKEDRWVPDDVVMKKLKITSKTTLQKLRDEGKIRFSQPSKKLILYDMDSVTEYLEKNAKDTF